MITTSAAWKTASQRPGELVVLARLYYGAEASFQYIKIGSKDITFPGIEFVRGPEKYLGLIQVYPSLQQSVNIDTHEPVIGNITLKLSNIEIYKGKRFSDYFGDDLGSGSNVGFENRRIDLRLWLPGIDQFENCFSINQQGINKNIDHDREIITINISDGIQLYLKQLNDQIKESDAILASGLPDDSKGRERQTIYGDHRYNVNAVRDYTPGRNLTKSSWKHDRNLNLVPAIDIGGDQWFIAKHDASSLDFDLGDGIWAWESSIGRYIELVDWSVIQNTSSGVIIKRTGNTFYDYRLAISSANFASGDRPWLNASRLSDTDTESKTTVTFSNTDANGFNAWIRAQMWDNAGEFDFDEVNDIVPYKSTQTLISVIPFVIFDSDDIPPGAFTITAKHATAGPWTISQDGDEASFRTVNVTNAVYPKWWSIIVTKIGAFIDSNWTSNLYEFMERAEFLDTERKPLFFAGKGKTYGTWINSRPNHIDNNDAGVLIENPAGVLEDFFRSSLNLSSKIDTNSFDQLSQDLDGLKVSCSITQSINSRDWVRDFLKEFRCFTWWDNKGEFKVQAINDTYSGSDVDAIIDYNEFFSLEFSRTDTDEIKTAVAVKYMKVDNSQQTKPYVTDTQIDTTAQDRWKLTTEQSKLDFESQYIADENTAISVTERFLNDEKNPHVLAIGELPKEYLTFDIGDIIQFKNVPLKAYGKDITISNTIAGQTIYPYFFVYDVRRGENAGMMVIEGFQLHKLDE